MGKGVSFSFMHNGFSVLSRSWLFVWSRFQVSVLQTSLAGDGFAQHHVRGARWLKKLGCMGDEGRQMTRLGESGTEHKAGRKGG